MGTNRYGRVLANETSDDSRVKIQRKKAEEGRAAPL